MDVTATTPVERVIAALEERDLVVQVAGRSQYRCPAHDDQHASLTVSEGADGRVLIYCQAGCPTQRVVDALGLKMADLFREPAKRRGGGRWTTEQIKARCVDPYPALYVHANGEPAFLVARHEFPGEPKKYPQYRPAPGAPGHWLKGLDGVTARPLFKLPSVVRAVETGTTIHIVEGEKCVAALEYFGYVVTCNPGGSGKWRRENTDSLRGAACVFVWPDNDPPGLKAAYQIGDELLRAGVRDVRIVELEGARGYDVADWVADHNPETAAADLATMISAAPQYVSPRATPAAQDDRPVIHLTSELAMLGDKVVEALAARPSGIFVRAGHLVRIVRDSGAKLERLTRAPDAPSIRHVEPETLREVLSKAARFERFDGRSGEYVPAAPPLDIARAILARGEWPGLPVIEGIVENPILMDDGTVHAEPGLHDKSGLYYVPNGSPPSLLEVVPDYRELASACAAKLLDPFSSYRFANPKAAIPALVAAILTPIARHLIRGPVPLFAVPAPKARSGKGKLCTSIGTIATGRDPAMFSGQKAREEWDKLLIAIATEGDRVLVFDNVTGTLYSPELAYAITTGTYRAREFGQNKRTLRAPWVATVYVNGNGLRLASDLSFRTIPIEIDFGVERPDLLKFDFDVVERVRSERAELFAAAMAIITAYIKAGRPKALEPWSDFKAWDGVIRQCVGWIGLGDPLAGRERVIEESDDEVEQVRIVLTGWLDAFGHEAATVPEAVRRASGGEFAAAHEVLRDALETVDPKLNARRIGAFLAAHKGYIVAGMKLATDEKRDHGYAKWRVLQVERAEEGSDA